MKFLFSAIFLVSLLIIVPAYAEEPTYFAEVDENDIVIRVIVISQDVLDTGNWGEPKNWIQTSLTGEFRGTYAGIGWFYDRENDVFLPSKPVPEPVVSEPDSIIPTNATETVYIIPTNGTFPENYPVPENTTTSEPEPVVIPTQASMGVWICHEGTIIKEHGDDLREHIRHGDPVNICPVIEETVTSPIQVRPLGDYSTYTTTELFEELMRIFLELASRQG